MADPVLQVEKPFQVNNTLAGCKKLECINLHPQQRIDQLRLGYQIIAADQAQRWKLAQPQTVQHHTDDHRAPHQLSLPMNRFEIGDPGRTEGLHFLIRQPFVFHRSVDVVKIRAAAGDRISQGSSHNVVGMITGELEAFDMRRKAFGAAAYGPGCPANALA